MTEIGKLASPSMIIRLEKCKAMSSKPYTMTDGEKVMMETVKYGGMIFTRVKGKMNVYIRGNVSHYEALSKYSDKVNGLVAHA